LRRRIAARCTRTPLDLILRKAPHQPDGAGESMVATFGMATERAESVYYDACRNADMPWPSVSSRAARPVTLDQSGYTKVARPGESRVRKKVIDAFWGTWKQYERTFGVTFYEMLIDQTRLSMQNVAALPGLDHAQARPTENPDTSSTSTLIGADEREPADAAPLLQAARRSCSRADMRYYDIYPRSVRARRVSDRARASDDARTPCAPGPEYVAR
jgi:oligoendopeptidase F